MYLWSKLCTWFIFSLNFSIFLTFLWYLNRFKVFKYSQYHPFSKRYLKSKDMFPIKSSTSLFSMMFELILAPSFQSNVRQFTQNLSGNSSHFQLTVSIGHESGHSLSDSLLHGLWSQAVGPGSTGSNREGLTASQAHSMVAGAFSFSTCCWTKDLNSLLPVSRSFSHLLATCASPTQQLFTKAWQKTTEDLLATGEVTVFLTPSQVPPRTNSWSPADPQGENCTRTWVPIGWIPGNHLRNVPTTSYPTGLFAISALP